jgi:hypothetical protein
LQDLRDDLREALATDELQGIMKAASPPLETNGVLVELNRRTQDINLELSSVDREYEAADALYHSAFREVSRRDDPTAGELRLGCASLIAALLVLVVVVPAFFGWTFAESLLATWKSPLWSGWVPAAFWGTAYGSVAALVWEADFRLRRQKKRRAQIELDEGLDSARSRRRDAVEARKLRLREILRDYVTELANQVVEAEFKDRIMVLRVPSAKVAPGTLTIATGLSEVATDSNEIPTAVKDQLLNRLEGLPGASIGISGPRGVGKSTLLRSVCGPKLEVGEKPVLTVLTAAPIEYDGREFLLHLFASLCREVLQREKVDFKRIIATDAVEMARRWREESFIANTTRYSRSILLMGVLFFSTAVVIGGLSTFARSSSDTPPISSASAQGPAPAVKAGAEPREASSAKGSPASARASQPSAKSASFNNFPLDLGLQPGPFATMGLILIMLGLSLRGLPGGLAPWLRGGRREAGFADPAAGTEKPELVAATIEEYRNIRFQRSHTSGWSGALKAPAGVEFGSSAGMTLAQQPESLPELVTRFRDYVASVVSAYGRVAFGIDELDKLRSAADAEAFVNGIKSVFGIRNCFYLISVSQHALSAFERRGLGFRDAFDSAFDDMVEVPLLDLPQSRALLARRVLRLPDPFVQLCHMLSGGLPRELIRSARLVIELAEAQGDRQFTLIEALDEIVRREAAAKVNATSLAIRVVSTSREANTILSSVEGFGSLDRLTQIEKAARRLRDNISAEAALPDNEEGGRLLTLCEELAIYLEMLGAMRRVGAIMSTPRGWEIVNETKLAASVAELRRAIEVSVPLARARLAELQPEIRAASRRAQWSIDEAREARPR